MALPGQTGNAHGQERDRDFRVHWGSTIYLYFPPPLHYLQFCCRLRYLKGRARYASKATDLQQQKDEQSPEKQLSEQGPE